MQLSRLINFVWFVGEQMSAIWITRPGWLTAVDWLVTSMAFACDLLGTEFAQSSEQAVQMYTESETLVKCQAQPYN
jgi:hypothetical protein